MLHDHRARLVLEVAQDVEGAVNVGDIEGFARVIDTILSDDTLAKNMGERGKEIANKKFTPEIIVPKYIEYYEKVLSE